MSDKLVIYTHLEQIKNAAIALHQSGYFQDVRTQAQAIVKVMAGAELGLPPFASMSGIHIIQGKPVLGANLIATLVKNDPRYDYRVVQADDQVCVLAWFEDGKPVGESSFTRAEAEAAGLTGKDNWRKFPSDMLFARTISRGARRFAPGIFGGSPVYTPEELGVETDAEGYVDVEASADAEEAATDVAAPQAEAAAPRLWPASALKLIVAKQYAKNEYEARGMLDKSNLPEQPAAEVALGWAHNYRRERDGGKTPDEAAQVANQAYLDYLSRVPMVQQPELGGNRE